LIVLGVAMAAASVVSPADADHGRRYKGAGGYPGGYSGGYPGGYGGVRVVRRVSVCQGRSYTYISRSSCGTPALAGFVGGLIVGNVLAHAAPPPQACPRVVDTPDYYYDPYCHESFSSLDAYGEHLNHCDHPALVRVIDGDTGRCVGEREWREGRWCDGGDDGGRYDDRDRNDDRDQDRDWNRR